MELDQSSSIATWTQKYQQGDASAGEALADHLRNIFSRRFNFAGLPRIEAEELAQQCIVDVFASLGRFEAERGSVESWASGVARNGLRNYYRRQQMVKTMEVRHEDLTNLVDETDVEPSSAAAISEAVTSLSLVDRELLNMRFALDMSFSEIAGATNLTETNARKRVSRAMEQLRRHNAIRALLA